MPFSESFPCEDKCMSEKFSVLIYLNITSGPSSLAHLDIVVIPLLSDTARITLFQSLKLDLAMYLA